MPTKTLTTIPEELGFRFQHGPVAKSLGEFREILAAAPAQVVWYHRDHYAAWLREVVRDLPLARRLEAYASTPPAPDVYRDLALSLVTRRLEELAKPS